MICRLTSPLCHRVALAACLAISMLTLTTHDVRAEEAGEHHGLHEQNEQHGGRHDGHEGHEHRGPLQVKVIGFNDYHGNLQSPGTFGQNLSIPAAQRPGVGGAEYVAAHVSRLKAQNRHHVVVGGGTSSAPHR
jgi:5'-nucleotidase